MNEIPWGWQLAVSFAVPVISAFGAYLVAIITAKRAEKASEYERSERRLEIERERENESNSWQLELVSGYIRTIRKRTSQNQQELAELAMSEGVATYSYVGTWMKCNWGCYTDLFSAGDELLLKLKNQEVRSLVLKIQGQFESQFLQLRHQINKIGDGEGVISDYDYGHDPLTGDVSRMCVALMDAAYRSFSAD